MQSCAIITGPWVVAPPSQPSALGSWILLCQNNEPAAGSNWIASDNRSGDMSVALDQTSGFAIMSGSPGLGFIGFYNPGPPQSYQPIMGCNGASTDARSAGIVVERNGIKRRVATHQLRPSRSRTVTHRCASGERLIGSRAGIAFFKKNAPSVQELREVSAARSESGGRVRVSISTGSHVGDNETVRLQVQAICR